MVIFVKSMDAQQAKLICGVVYFCFYNQYNITIIL